MAKLAVKPGTTSLTVYVFIRDSSATTGVGLTGLAYNSGSLVASYVRPLAARAAITLATQTTTGAYSSGGFVEVDSTNMPGIYRLDIPDAAIAAGVRSSVVMLKGASNMEPCVIEIDLTNEAKLADGVTHGGSTAVIQTERIIAASTTTNEPGIKASGNGTAAGVLSTGGATGHGLSLVGGATSGDGLRAAAATSGKGINAIGVGTTQAGILATGGATTSAGISAVGGSTSGDAILTAATSGHGIVAAGTGTTKHGINATGGSTSSAGINAAGGGTGAGILATGGATGQGMSLVGGATSGNGLGIDYTAPIGPVKELGILESGTLQSATGTTAVLRSATSFGDDVVIGATLAITSGTGSGQSRLITDWVNSTDTATVDTWTTTPDNTSTYEVYRTAAGSGGSGLDAAATRAALGLASANLDTQLSGIQSDTNDIQTRIPAALVSGRIDASVGAMAANVLTATAINADAITAAKVAADVTTEIQTGLATAAAVATVSTAVVTTIPATLTTIAGYIDTEVAAILAAVDTEVSAILADTNELQTDWANGGRLDNILDARASQTTVDTLSGYVDTEVNAIKTKTDQLTFGATNALNANVTHVIADPVQENGANDTNWGGAP